MFCVDSAESELGVLDLIQVIEYRYTVVVISFVPGILLGCVITCTQFLCREILYNSFSFYEKDVVYRYI